MYYTGLYYTIIEHDCSDILLYNFGEFLNIYGDKINVTGLQLVEVTNANFPKTLEETKRKLWNSCKPLLQKTSHQYIFHWNNKTIVYDAMCNCFVYPTKEVTYHNPFDL